METTTETTTTTCECEAPLGFPGDSCETCGELIPVDLEAAMIKERRGRRTQSGSTYVWDKVETATRLQELEAAVAMARYELESCVALTHAAGMSWTEIGDALGKPRQNVHRSYGNVDACYLSMEERHRLERLVGIRKGQAKLQVRRITSGKRGVSRLVWDLVSQHVKYETAEARALKVAGQGFPVEIVLVYPDGREELRRQIAPGATVAARAV